jgi:putative DNA primase/helicase
MNATAEKLVSAVSACPDAFENRAITGFDEFQDVDTPVSSGVPRVPKEKERPYYDTHKTHGLWGAPGVYCYPREKDNGEVPPPVWICSPLDVVARTRSADSEEWGRLLEWHDPDGIFKQWAMPEQMLASSEAADILRVLMAGGLDVSFRCKKDLISYLASRRPFTRAVCVQRCGWADLGVYVLPGHVVNETNGDKYIFQAENRPEPHASRGTLESWRDDVAALAVGNSRLMFAICCAFAGPLLEPCGLAGGGFHFVGASSIGKSLSMLMAASVIGDPSKGVLTWRATDNGLEGVAYRHCDGLLCLDELGQVDGRKAGEIAYMLANGTGKARATKEGGARSRQTWRLVFLSNGELDLSSHMASVGQQAKAGQEVRMVSIPADAGKGLGIFESLHGEPDAKAMADRVKRATIANYGCAFVPFIQHVAEQPETISRRVSTLVADFTAANVPAGADGQVYRAAERFALVAAAGVIATEAGITGWDRYAALFAARDCFNAWLERRGGAGSHEDAEIISRLMQTLTADGSRFESMATANATDAPKVHNRLGFVEGGRYTIPVSCFKEIFAGIDDARAAKVLVAAGIIKHELGKALPRPILPGLGRQRCYSIDSGDLPA